MDTATLNTVVGIVGTVATVISTVVGIIGAKSLKTAKQIIKTNNHAKAGDGSTVNQGNTYNYRVGEETVRLITKDMTKEEMCQLIIRLIPIHTDDENCVGNRLRKGTVTADDFDRIIDEIPTVYYGKNPPPDFSRMKDGNIWWNIE